jgi:hypothetical protein
MKLYPVINRQFIFNGAGLSLPLASDKRDAKTGDKKIGKLSDCHHFLVTLKRAKNDGQ